MDNIEVNFYHLQKLLNSDQELNAGDKKIIETYKFLEKSSTKKTIEIPKNIDNTFFFWFFTLKHIKLIFLSPNCPQKNILYYL